MSPGRIEDHPVLGPLRERRSIAFTFDGQDVSGYEGEPIAAALLACGIRTLRYHEETGTPRGIYCNIGHCFECRVTVNGVGGVRACLTPVQAEMNVERGLPLPSPLKKGGEPL
ncbi:(2Fe-2S)-binding protein [Paenibacillus humicola]|uniref:(2Fe-2S)-binding protein n=1 Tax=Paenibacillus humicola TaxID=3110540 RepID=UPI00237A2CDF|nr:(2Fe-2S)-binding protein [Paenibacillus humicola]